MISTAGSAFNSSAGLPQECSASFCPHVSVVLTLEKWTHRLVLRCEQQFGGLEQNYQLPLICHCQIQSKLLTLFVFHKTKSVKTPSAPAQKMLFRGEAWIVFRLTTTDGCGIIYSSVSLWVNMSVFFILTSEFISHHSRFERSYASHLQRSFRCLNMYTVTIREQINT